MGGHVADPPTEVITDAGPGSAGLGKASPSRPDAEVRAAQLRREVVALARLNPSVAFGWSMIKLRARQANIAHYKLIFDKW